MNTVRKTGYRVKSRIVTFYVTTDEIAAEYDVRVAYFRTTSVEDAIVELGVYAIPEADVRAAHYMIRSRT